MELRHQPHQRFAGIDGMRAFAVISVLIFHLNHSLLPGGFVGVDVFFVISGYVVCGSLLKDRGAPFLTVLGQFYVRRILRIYPALIVVLLTAGVLSTLFIPYSFLSSLNTQTGKWAFFGGSKIVLSTFHNSYFSPSTDFNPYAHTWSLGVEEQFYFLFPPLLFVLHWAGQRKGVLRWSASILMPALVLFSWLYCAYQTSSDYESAYFNLPSRFWELAVGAALSLAHDRKRFLPVTRWQSNGVLYAGMTLLLLAVCFTDSLLFPFPLSAVPVVGALCSSRA